MKKGILIFLIAVILISAFTVYSRLTYNGPIICWVNVGESDKEYIQISRDETKKILKLLRNGEWTEEGDNPNEAYVLRLRGGRKIYYTLSGKLYDVDKKKYLYLAEEDWVYINRILLSQYMPPVEKLGPIVYGDKMTISEAIDKFQVKLEEADRGGSLIIDQVFGGDVELAKQTMDSEISRELFETPYIRMERFFDDHEWRISLTSEEFRVSSSGIVVWMRTEQKHNYDAKKVISDKGEYYIDGAEIGGRRYIDLGEGVFIFLEVAYDAPHRDKKMEQLLDYGFSIRNCVPDWEASPLI